MFRRRRRADDADDAVDDLADDALDEDGPVEDEGVDLDEGGRPEGSAGAVTSGPWDAADAPEDGVPRVDLGSLQVPVPEGLDVRVDVQDQTVVAATLVDGHSALQVHAFAAPRSSGIWTEVREEIAQSLRSSGGSAEEAHGPFGAELRARIPAELPGQGTVLQAARFLGVDGPRWFVRGLMTGPAATDPNQARRLEAAFRGLVVVRGGEAMAPRDMLPLRLPKDAVAAHPDHPAEPEPPRLEMPRRGPEITETR